MSLQAMFHMLHSRHFVAKCMSDKGLKRATRTLGWASPSRHHSILGFGLEKTVLRLPEPSAGNYIEIVSESDREVLLE